ncbi:MAG TPA: hypothetical protein VFB25_10800 [Gaiellaceae bacterium]|nr:hypothetical protein [Gaiellaceae bacterium]
MDLVRFNRNENVGVAHCSWDEFAAWRDAVCAPSEPDAAISYLWSLPCPQRDDRYGIDNTWADNAPAIGDQGVGLWGASEWCIWAFTLPPGGLPSDGQGGAWRADGTYGLNFESYGVLADGPYTDVVFTLSQAAYVELEEILGLLTMRETIRSAHARYPIIEFREAA